MENQMFQYFQPLRGVKLKLNRSLLLTLSAERILARRSTNVVSTIRSYCHRLWCGSCAVVDFTRIELLVLKDQPESESDGYSHRKDRPAELPPAGDREDTEKKQSVRRSGKILIPELGLF